MFTQAFSKDKAVKKRNNLRKLEDKVKESEINLSTDPSCENKNIWLDAKKNMLEQEYESITQGSSLKG